MRPSSMACRSGALWGLPLEDIDVPTVVSQFPRDLVRAPRSLAEQLFDLRVWQEPEAGGHFAAWEVPEAVVTGVRAALDLA